MKKILVLGAAAAAVMLVAGTASADINDDATNIVVAVSVQGLSQTTGNVAIGGLVAANINVPDLTHQTKMFEWQVLSVAQQSNGLNNSQQGAVSSAIAIGQVD
jgi:outer membrane murein-binding lipoprotein Lpp